MTYNHCLALVGILKKYDDCFLMADIVLFYVQYTHELDLHITW